MDRRVKITLPEPMIRVLEDMAESKGEPVSRIAAQIVCNGIGELNGVGGPRVLREPVTRSAAVPSREPGERAPWLVPYPDDLGWRSQMWGAVVALHARYRRHLGHLKDGWWENEGHVETICALVIWRDWIDHQATDPRDELAFQAQLDFYADALRREGGSVSDAWTPGAPPDEWAY